MIEGQEVSITKMFILMLTWWEKFLHSVRPQVQNLTCFQADNATGLCESNAACAGKIEITNPEKHKNYSSSRP